MEQQARVETMPMQATSTAFRIHSTCANALFAEVAKPGQIVLDCEWATPGDGCQLQIAVRGDWVARSAMQGILLELLL